MVHLATKQASEPIGQASAVQASPPASKLYGRGKVEQQYALHVIDYCAWKTLADLRAMGACGWPTRKLTEVEFDYSQFSEENGDGPIY